MAPLSEGSIDIDQGNPQGWTPLIVASGMDYSRAVRILLNKGANVSIMTDGGVTALLLSAQKGHLEANTSGGSATPLHLAAEYGHSEVMSMLI